MDNLLKPKIVIVDNSKLFRKTVAEILETELNAETRQAHGSKDLHELLKIFTPDIIIYDLYSVSNNFEITMRKIHQKCPNAKVVVLSFETNVELEEYCIEHGASGFLDKSITDVDVITNYIRKILTGKLLVLTPLSSKDATA